MSERPNFFDAKIGVEALSELEIKCLGCGHMSPVNFEITLWGKTITLGIKEQNIEVVDGIKTIKGICHECLFEKIKRDSIRCCLCGRVIMPGDAVAVYDYKHNQGSIHKDIATFVGDKDRPIALGCLFQDCTTGAFYGGKWTTDGFVATFGGGNIAQAALAKPGEFVSVQNL